VPIREELEAVIASVGAAHRDVQGPPPGRAFRWMVGDNGGSKAKWKGEFSAVRKVWDKAGPEMMKLTQDTSVDNARETVAIGKSATHYNALHSAMAKAQLMSRA
jgi:hypothetical protein